MIDYEKLKKAHELMYELCSKDKSTVFGMTFGEKLYEFAGLERYRALVYENTKGCNAIRTDDIDDLIAKLKELNPPEPKYKIGNRIWYQDRGKPFGANIVDIRNGEYEIDDSKNNNGKSWFAESELYPTKQCLIEAQIVEYYNDKKLPDKCGLTVKDICVHEDDGNIYWDAERFPARYNCIKCGEFYK